MNTEFWFENQKERGHLKNLDVDARLQVFPAVYCFTLRHVGDKLPYYTSFP